MVFMDITQGKLVILLCCMFLQVISCTDDFEDTEVEKIKSFIKDFNINYPILLTDVYNPTEFEQKNSLGLPTTVFFNPEGVQFDKRVGPVHYKDLVEITGLTPTETSETESITE